MRKNFFIVIFIFICGICYAQRPYKVYCMVSYYSSGEVYIDNGMRSKTHISFMPSESLLVDENGKEIVFNSHVSLLNYMSKLGWQVEEQMSLRFVSIDRDNPIDQRINWYMSKTVDNDEQISEGILTKGMLEKKK